VRMERVKSCRKDPTTYLARVLSLSALVVCVAAFVGILVQGAPKAPASATGRPEVERLEVSAARLAAELAALRPGTSAQRARRALHAAVADNRAVAFAIRRAEAAGLLRDERLANAVDAQREYLDALGSSLSNPRSPLLRHLADRARRVRAAFASLPGAGGLQRTISGWQRLATTTASRVRASSTR
jgi:hypothetical protein